VHSKRYTNRRQPIIEDKYTADPALGGNNGLFIYIIANDVKACTKRRLRNA